MLSGRQLSVLIHQYLYPRSYRGQRLHNYHIAVLQSHKLLDTHVFADVLEIGRHALPVYGSLWWDMSASLLSSGDTGIKYLCRTLRRRLGKLLNRSCSARHC